METENHSPRWRQPTVLLFIMAAAMPFSMGTWMALINNFSVEYAQFDGADMGILQSLREIPGFLSFAVIFLLLIIKEQTLAVVSLALLGLGTALTGLLPSFMGLCFTTVLMSVGFHYFETVNQSLQLQWLKKGEAPKVMGKLIAMGSATALTAYGMVYIGLEYFGLSMIWIYLIGGGITFMLAVTAWSLFPHFPEKVEQRKKLFLKKRYWLYYALVFMSGARRQIFVVFAGFLMVEKFDFTASEITLMFIANMAINIIVAPMIGKLIAHWGERRALTFEYIGLIGVFSAYALVESATWGATLYIIDHLFFAMAIAIKTYFQKISSPEDIAPTAGVSFTINHIAAVVIPASFGLLWLISPAIVFYAGAAMAGISLVLAQLVPDSPADGEETRLSQPVPVSL
ncbi:MFS transporter [Neptunomonas qingdaonensis]|uniref:Predicted arabinose efflux permease, MFS family n=1 Tax=Neptunomonas qingdaonensis TaxID=1045558 RepID=A0A1I2U919_9GAMM|nr:MFS transporter [Neptunomonas qingdaonensis]SFG72157.1 Predicted arabinose efflux permease, MFS family [Neptunomonas qingdaonensis]